MDRARSAARWGWRAARAVPAWRWRLRARSGRAEPRQLASTPRARSKSAKAHVLLRLQPRTPALRRGTPTLRLVDVGATPSPSSDFPCRQRVRGGLDRRAATEPRPVSHSHRVRDLVRADRRA